MTTGVYLDWNATGPVVPEVRAAMAAAGDELWGNSSSVHGFGRRARQAQEALRAALARLVGASPRDVVLTSGGTEANILALHSAPGLALSRLEHPSITKLAERFAFEGRPVRWLSILPTGHLDPAAIDDELAGLPLGSRVCCQAVNHELGTIQPVAAVAEVVRRKGYLLHVDAVQAVGKLPAAAWRDGDSFSVAAHKFGGPKGIGALIWRCGADPKPLLAGGGQERGLRPGTASAELAVGFARALELAAAGVEAHAALRELRDWLRGELAPWAQFAGGAPELGHVLSLHVKGVPGDLVVAAADLEGVAVSSGSACSAGTAERSPVLAAVLGEEAARGAVRISLGRDTTLEDVARAAEVLRRILQRFDHRAG